MSSYEFLYADKFSQRLEQLEAEVRERILKKLAEFKRQVNDYGIDPRQHNSTKFIATDRTWRLRIGSYRAFFDILDGTIKFTTVLSRDQAYR